MAFSSSGLAVGVVEDAEVLAVVSPSPFPILKPSADAP
jgi:hypothetical protein